MKRLDHHPQLRAAAVLLAVVATATSLFAHDFWLVPDAFRVTPGGWIEVRGQTSSRFPTSESAVGLDRVADARVISATSEEPIGDLSHSGTSLVLRSRPTQPGQRIIAMTLHPRSVRESPESFRRYLELEGAPEALERYGREGRLSGTDSVTRRYAKYAKTFVEVAERGPRAWERVAGHPLEFVPLSDPATLRLQDTLAVRLLYRGRPLAGARLHAGVAPQGARARLLGEEPHLVTDENGVVRVFIHQVGIWNVRTLQIVPADAGSGADWDAHWATMVFDVAQRGTGMAVAQPTRAPATRSDSANAAAVVERFHQALAEGDSAAALALLAPDATILESGGVETRAEYRGHHLPGDIEFARAVRSQRTPVRVTVRGDVAWAVSTSTTQGEFRGRQINSAGAELMVLTRTGSGWRISAIHWSSRARRP
jgi:ketosteroid isomerase-like protein